MKKAPRIKGIAALVVVLFSFGLWQWGPFSAVFAIANLIDPAKLEKLGDRGANPRLNKTVYWLDTAERHFLGPHMAITMAQTINGTGGKRAELTRDSLLRNLKIAHELGLLTADNREKLRGGHAGIITLGPYAGETVEIDHIVPFSLAPELGNNLANLEMIPRTINRRKLDHVGARQLQQAEVFFQAGLLSPKSYEKVKAKARIGGIAR
jgi:hypothetical protein